MAVRVGIVGAGLWGGNHAVALKDHPGVKHVKVEDGPGKPLGRHYRVKLWPTLVFLKDGQEVARVTRPSDGAQLRAALAQIT